MDVSSSIEPKSDQQNYDDYVTGPKTVTVTGVKQGPPDQPVHVHLAEYPDRPYKPAKSMRRVLVAVWGKDAAAWAGRRLTLYGDPAVKFGGQAVGGIRISHMSHIDKPVTISLTVTRGKRAPFTVQPLPDAPDDVAEWIAAFTSAVEMGELQGAWAAAPKHVTSHPDAIAAKDARKGELS